MKERIATLISSLEHDPNNADILTSLEEAITGDGVEEQLVEIRTLLADGVERLEKAGRFRAVNGLLEISEVVCEDGAAEATLLIHQARILDEELFEQGEALEKLQRAKSLCPEDSDLEDKVMLMKAERERYREIVETFKEQAETATDASLKAHMLYSAAERLYKNDPDNEDIERLLRAAIDEDNTHQRAARLLERIFEVRSDWTALAALYMDLAKRRKSKHERVQMFLAAGYTYAVRLDELDEAARCYTSVLDYQPGQPAALKFLVKYYEDKEDWDHLVAVYEDTLHGKLTPEDEVAACMQVGMVHWRFRNDLESAQKVFRRLSRISAAHPGMIEFYRAYCKAKNDNQLLLKVLEGALRATDDESLRETLTREVAELSAVDGQNVEKAIDAWKKVLRQGGNDEQAVTELKKLYRHAGKWNNLIDLIRSEVDGLAEDDVAGRVAKLNEMVEIYRDEMKLEMMVIKTLQAILAVDEGNVAAMDQLIETYEGAKRWSDLIKVLNTRAAACDDQLEKIRTLNRIAVLWVERFNNFNRAVEPLEEILELDPKNAEAINSLKGIYEKRRAWKPMLALLEKEAAMVDAASRIDVLRQMATICGDKLNDYSRAIALWWEVWELDSEDGRTLDTLERLCERVKDWEGLTRVLEFKIDRADRDEQIALLTKLGTVQKDRVKDPAAAALVWKRLLDVDEGNPKAMRSLKDAYQAAADWGALEALFAETGDYESLVEVLGIAADRADDAETRIMLSFKCAALYNDQIGQPDRALRHYERVLATDETNVAAATALAPIYRRSEKWSRLVRVLEVMLEATDNRDERLALIDELQSVARDHLNNRELAFKWAMAAFEESPADASLRDSLETAAEQAHAFDRLVTLYQAHLDDFEGEDRVAMERHVASISLEKLGDVESAVERYRAVLADQPGDDNALLALDSIFRSTGQWDALEEIYAERIKYASDDEVKRRLMMGMAQMYEEGMDDPMRAAARFRTVLEMAPGDGEALAALERIFIIQERYSDLAEILAEQRNGLPIGEDLWREKSFQLAGVLADHLAEAERAVTIYQELLSQYPGDDEVVMALEPFLKEAGGQQFVVAQILAPHLEEREDWRRLAWVLSILIENTRDVEARVDLQVRLADCYAGQLLDEQLAFETLAHALSEDPNNRDLWVRMTELSVHLNNQEALANCLATAFDDEKTDDSARLALAEQLCGLYDDALGLHAESERFHQFILRERPDAVESFNALEQFYTTAEKWTELLALYKGARENDSYTGGLLELLLKICFVVYEVQHDVDSSIAAYRDVLEIDGANEEANRALVTLYEEADRWRDLMDLLNSQLSGATDADQVAIQFRLGEICEIRLGQMEEAIGYYETVLSLDPDHLKTQHALERLLKNKSTRQRAAALLAENYEHQGAAEPLVRVLLIGLEQSDLDNASREDVLLRVADLRERRLGDADGAFEALKQALMVDLESELAFEELERVATTYDMGAAFCETINGLLPQVEDHDLAGKFLLAVARTTDRLLHDEEGSIKAWRAVLDHDPSNPESALPAINALDLLLTKQQAVQELVETLRKKVGLLDDPTEQCDVLLRMSELEETALERSENAVALFKEVLDIDEANLPALHGLERIYTLSEDWSALVSVLRQRAAVELDVEERRRLLLQVAELVEKKLEQPDAAIDAYTQVGLEVGDDLTALSALERLLTERSRWSDLLDCLEAQRPLRSDVNDLAALLFRTGQVLAHHLDAPEEAVARYGEALELVPELEGLVPAIEELLDGPAKMGAIELLLPIARSEANHEKLLRYTLVQAQSCDDPNEQSNLYLEAAKTAELGLDDGHQAFSLYCKALQKGAVNASLETIMGHVERLKDEFGDPREVATLYQEVAADILDGSLQVHCYQLVADLAYHQLADLELAREYYLKIMDADGGNDAALNSLEEIYRQGEEYLELFEVYRQKVQNCYDDDVCKEILFKQALLCEEHLDDPSSATTTYEAILEIDPSNREATSALERMYAQEERWADLVDLLERRRSEEPENGAALSHQLGQLIHDKLGDVERAYEFFKEALEIDLEYTPTMELLESYLDDDEEKGAVARILEPVYSSQGNWEKLAVVVEAQVELCDDLTARKELLVRLGTVYEEQLGDLDQAMAAFARLFEADPEDTVSRERLVRLAGVQDQWSGLAEVFARVLDDVVADSPEIADLAFMLGEIYENRLEDPEKARACYSRVLSFAPDDRRAFDAVERMLLATASFADLLALYRDAADAAMDVDARKAFLFKMADIHEESLNDQAAAIDVYQEVLNIDDTDEQATDALDRLYFQTERFEDLAEHFRRQIDLASALGPRNALRRELAKLMEEKLSDLAGAVGLYEEALLEGEGDRVSQSQLERLILNEEIQERVANILEPIYRANDEWKKLVVILQTQVKFLDDPQDMVEKYREIALLHETRGGNYLLAFRSLAKAFELAPEERDAYDEMNRLVDGIENWEDLAASISGVVENVGDYDFKKELLLRLGATYDQKLDQPRKAIEAYQGVLEIDESSIEAMDALEGLYNLVGDWDGLTAILGQKAQSAGDPESQSELLRAKAAIEEELKGDSVLALATFEEALSCDPQSVVTMVSLERLYEAAGKWEELVEVRRQHVDLVTDSAERVALLCSLAQIVETKLNDPYDAISAWKQVMDEDPENHEAIKSLESLFTSQEQWSELLDNLQLQKELCGDQATWVDLTMRIGNLKRVELADYKGAIASYQDVIAQQPTHKDAIDLLSQMAEDEMTRMEAIDVLDPLHREAGRYDQLVHLQRLKLEMVNTPEDRLSILLDIAQMQESGRSDINGAFEAYVEAFQTMPDRVDVRAELERLASAESLFGRLAAVYEEESENIYDMEVQKEVLLSLGEIRELQLGDLKGAIKAYRQIFDNGDTSQNVLSALDRLYEREEMWGELDEVLVQEIQMADDEEQGYILKMRQGHLRALRFEDYMGAMGIYRDILEAAPHYDDAVSALEELLKRDDLVMDVSEILGPVYEQRGDGYKVVHLLERRLAVAIDDADKQELYRELARHQEDVAGDPTAAFDALGHAFALAPDDAGLADELERLAEVTGSWTALVEVAEKAVATSDLDRNEKVALGLKIAGWAFEHVGDPAKAESLYRGVLEQDPDHQEALGAMVNLLGGLGRFEDLLPILEHQANVAYDFAVKKEILVRAAQIAQMELNNSKEALRLYRKVLDVDESDLSSLDAVIDLLDKLEEYGPLSETLLSRAGFTGDVTASNQFRHRAAALYMGPLDERERGIEVFGEILEMNPDDQQAINALSGAFEEAGRWADLKELIQHQLDGCGDEQQRMVLLGRVADLCETRLDEVDEAVDRWQEMLMIDPGNEVAQSGLERVFVAHERWSDLVDLLEERARRAEDQGDGPLELATLVRIGEVAMEHMDDQIRATEIYERVLARDPDHTRALSSLARLYESQGAWEDVARVLERAAAIDPQGADGAEVHVRLALLKQHRFDDPAGAEAELQKAVRLYPQHLEANGLLAEICLDKKDYNGLLETLMREEMGLSEASDKVAKLIEIADVQRSHLGDITGEVNTLERAYGIDKGNRDVLLRLSDAYIDAGRQDEAIPVLNELIDVETDGGKKRSKTAAGFHAKLAKAYRARGDEERAIENLQLAYRMDISNTEVLVALGQLYYEKGELDQAAKLFRALLLQRFETVAGLTKADIYCYVGEIQLKQGEGRKAKGMFRRGLDEDKNHAGCLAGMEKC